MEKKKIYIIDNNEIERENLKEILNEEYEIVGIGDDGFIANEFLNENQVDLIVMDIVIKSLDGYELIEKINSNLGIKRPKILVLSSLKGDGFVQKAIDLGADYYMVKPVLEDVLRKRIKSLFEDANEKRQGKPSIVNKALDEKISNVFITVGIPAHIKGYQFLREAIKMAIDEPDIINSITKQLYPSIADRFSTSASKVERAIRHAIEVAWNRGKIENINSLFGIKVYSSNEKPTNGEFIALVADKMLIEGA